MGDIISRDPCLTSKNNLKNYPLLINRPEIGIVSPTPSMILSFMNSSKIESKLGLHLQSGCNLKRDSKIGL